MFPRIHYIHDFMCGWCYGSLPLLAVAAQIPGARLALHAGGLRLDHYVLPVNREVRDLITKKDVQVTAATGVHFGANFRHKLLASGQFTFDSEPATCAWLAVTDHDVERGLAYYPLVLRALFAEGKDTTKLEVLRELAYQVAMEREDFDAAYAAFQGATTRAHFEQSRALLHRVGGQGYPSFVLERGGQFTLLAHQQFYQKPQAWAEYLESLLGH